MFDFDDRGVRELLEEAGAPVAGDTQGAQNSNRGDRSFEFAGIKLDS